MTEILLLPLVGVAIWKLRSLKELGWAGAFLVGFLAVTTVRFLASLPHWGVLAVRDYTTPLEMLAVVVGFWAVKEYGLGKWIRTWLVIFLVLLLYTSLYPFREALSASGPVVGLQRPVPLLGQYVGAGIAVGAAFFFFHLNLKRTWSFVLGTWCLVLLAILQWRGLYLAVPLAALAIAAASWRIGRGVALHLAGGFVLAVFVLFLVAPLVPQGRVGSIAPEFYASHFLTLFGGEGPAGGTIEDRKKWQGALWDRVRDQPAAILVGLGLGPDLIPTHRGPGGVLVRKPHNDYLEIFARFGILGLGLWVGFIGSALGGIWSAIKRQRAQDAETRFLVWVLALATVYLFVSAAQPLMAFPYGTIPLFTTLGMGLAVATRPIATTTVPRYHPRSVTRQPRPARPGTPPPAKEETRIY